MHAGIALTFIQSFAIALAVATSTAAQPLPSGAPVLLHHDEATLAKGGVVTFQRGAFRIDDSGAKVTLLCVPMKGQWKQVGSLRDCGNPPPEMQRELLQFEPDVTMLGIRYLGVATEQWDTVRKLAAAGPPGNALSKVGQAFSYSVGGSDVRWRFESRKLPEELKTPIPGGGIQMHFGGLLSAARELPLFEPGRDLEIETRLAVPTLAFSGNAHSGLTVAVNLGVRTVRGDPSALAVIVALVHRNPVDREAVRSDGRRDFVSSYLGPATRYVQHVENRHRTAPWPGLERFAFRLTRENVRRIMADANARRRATGGELLDEASLERITVAGITVRNESRFLNEGDVAIEVVVDYLRAARVTALAAAR